MDKWQYFRDQIEDFLKRTRDDLYKFKCFSRDIDNMLCKEAEGSDCYRNIGNALYNIGELIGALDITEGLAQMLRVNIKLAQQYKIVEEITFEEVIKDAHKDN